MVTPPQRLPGGGALTRLRGLVLTRARKPAMQIVALRGGQTLLNPISQLVLVARFGVAEYGIYAAAQALAAALERIISFGVVDFAVREFILQGDARHWAFKAIYVSRVLFYLVVTGIVAFVFSLLDLSPTYVLYFALQWLIQFSLISNKIIESLLRSIDALPALRWIYVVYIAIDLVAFVGVLFFHFDYVAYLLTRGGALLVFAAINLALQRRYFVGLVREAGRVWAEFRRTVQLSLYFGAVFLLRDLNNNWLVVAYAAVVDPLVFGTFSILNRVLNIIVSLINTLMDTVTYPRLVKILGLERARFEADYTRLLWQYRALAGVAGVTLAMGLAGIELFVFDLGESFGLAFFVLALVKIVVVVLMLTPLKLVIAAGRAKERVQRQLIVVGIVYATLFAGLTVWPLGALIVAQLVGMTCTSLLLRPVISNIRNEVGDDARS